MSGSHMSNDSRRLLCGPGLSQDLNFPASWPYLRHELADALLIYAHIPTKHRVTVPIASIYSNHALLPFSFLLQAKSPVIFNQSVITVAGLLFITTVLVGSATT
jgi:hypothetical protein